MLVVYRRRMIGRSVVVGSIEEKEPKSLLNAIKTYR